MTSWCDDITIADICYSRSQLNENNERRVILLFSSVYFDRYLSRHLIYIYFWRFFFFFFNLRMKSIHCEEYWCTNKEQHSFHKNRKFPIFLDAKCRYVFTEWQQPYNGTCVIIYACFGLSFKLQKMWSLFFASISWIAKLTSHDYNSFVHHEKMELFTFSLVLFS